MESARERVRRNGGTKIAMTETGPWRKKSLLFSPLPSAGITRIRFQGSFLLTELSVQHTPSGHDYFGESPLHGGRWSNLTMHLVELYRKRAFLSTRPLGAKIFALYTLGGAC